MLDEKKNDENGNKKIFFYWCVNPKLVHWELCFDLALGHMTCQKCIVKGIEFNG